jgi:hypothetical protein
VNTMRIYGNLLPQRAVERAKRLRNRFERKFPDDIVPEVYYAADAAEEEPDIGIRTLGESGEPIDPDKGIVLGTIRMGYGHYRISLAIASAANSMGLTSYWLDFLSVEGSRGAGVIDYMENLYNFGSRLSQRSALFNRLVWDRITGDSGLKIANTARDHELSKLYAPICEPLPKDVGYIATHPWTARAAAQAGIETVITAIPDNLPMSFHLSPGSIHTVQTPSAYFGYRSLRNMGEPGRMLEPMPDEAIRYAGHYVDHEIVSGIEEDCNLRFKRVREKLPRRVLLTIGGAGAQRKKFETILGFLKPYIRRREVTIFVNMGDHADRWTELKTMLERENISYDFYSDWAKAREFAAEVHNKNIPGVHVFLFDRTFPSVYLTNLLMRASDVMITKPSELSFYPVPKLFIQRVGKHEAWGAIRGSEIGDSTMETENTASMLAALKLTLEEEDLIPFYCQNILMNKNAGIYDGAYKVVRLALDARERRAGGISEERGAAVI